MLPQKEQFKIDNFTVKDDAEDEEKKLKTRDRIKGPALIKKGFRQLRVPGTSAEDEDNGDADVTITQGNYQCQCHNRDNIKREEQYSNTYFALGSTTDAKIKAKF